MLINNKTATILFIATAAALSSCHAFQTCFKKPFFVSVDPLAKSTTTPEAAADVKDKAGNVKDYVKGAAGSAKDYVKGATGSVKDVAVDSKAYVKEKSVDTKKDYVRDKAVDKKDYAGDKEGGVADAVKDNEQTAGKKWIEARDKVHDASCTVGSAMVRNPAAIDTFPRRQIRPHNAMRWNYACPAPWQKSHICSWKDPSALPMLSSYSSWRVRG